MTNHNLSPSGGAASKSPVLSPEEQAVLDSASNAALRKIFATIWQTKLRLQYTGWLQYIPVAILAFVFFLAAALIRLVGLPQVANIFVIAGVFLGAVEIFDLVTVKFRLRFPEHLPERNDDLSLFDLMRARRSCRSFQTRKLTPADFSKLMETVRLHSAAPTIGSGPVRFEYVSAPLTVWPTVNATQFLVAIAPSTYDRLAIIDVGRSLQKIVMDATRMGLATCWIGPGADQSSVVECLGDRYSPEDDHIICVCAVGYKSWYIPTFIRIFNIQFRRRRPLSSLFFADACFEEPLAVDRHPFSEFGRTYEICQWAPSSYNGQTTRCVAVVDGSSAETGARDQPAPHLDRFDFYAVTDSRYYAAVAVGIWCANWEMGCEALGIAGHLAILPAGVREEQSCPQAARFDVSWVLDGNF